MKVAVIGGGIAGAGAAWALHQSGIDVEVFEANARLGGNAKIHDWQVNGKTWPSGLSVLAWPSLYFRNYSQLLQYLGIPTQEARIRFFVTKSESSSKGESEKKLSFYAHERESDLRNRFSHDFKRWSSMIRFVERVNYIFRLGGPPSLYGAGVFNPLNFLSLYSLSRIFRVSEEFWRTVFVPIHASSFLTTSLDDIPAVLLPILEDMISLHNGGVMTTWARTSKEVFESLTKSFESKVHLSTPILSVTYKDDKLIVHDEHGPRGVFDKVIFACNATSALRALPNPSWLERFILSKITYAEDFDTTFMEGRIHSDVSVLPSSFVDDITSNFANYIHVTDNGRGHSVKARWRYDCTFVISSWAPCVKPVKSQKAMLVSYGEIFSNDLRLKDSPIISNRRAHPNFDLKNLILSFLLHKIQGTRKNRRGEGMIWYCGSYTTPGNGHDLSLLSGFIACEKVGGHYPFTSNSGAYNDFSKLRSLMFPRSSLFVAVIMVLIFLFWILLVRK